MGFFFEKQLIGLLEKQHIQATLKFEKLFYANKTSTFNAKKCFYNTKIKREQPFLALNNKMTIVDESLIQTTQIRFS